VQLPLKQCPFVAEGERGNSLHHVHRSKMWSDQLRESQAIRKAKRGWDSADVARELRITFWASYRPLRELENLEWAQVPAKCLPVPVPVLRITKFLSVHLSRYHREAQCSISSNCVPVYHTALTFRSTMPLSREEGWFGAILDDPMSCMSALVSTRNVTKREIPQRA